jgi:hypothetical protein
MRYTLLPLAILFAQVCRAQMTPQAALPVPDHIVIVIMENHGYSEIIGSSAAPHINALANSGALFTQSFAIEHPSQPNYLDLYAGCNQGITDDGLPTSLFTTDNLGRQLNDRFRTFTTFSEGLPSAGFNGATSGKYARKHNPCANWVGTQANGIPVASNLPFTAFPTDFTKLPTVSYVVPNLDNDMHDGSIQTGDTWVNTNLNNYIEWAKTHNSLFILTFDEDDNGATNQIATFFIGQMVKQGQYSEHINHYTILRTIEDMYSLPYACNAASATPITDVWNSSSVAVTPSHEKVFSIIPNPSNGDITIYIDQAYIGKLTTAAIFDEKGVKVFEKNIGEAQMISAHFTPGSYVIKISDGKSQWTDKCIVK